ncbi:MlaD family protein [Nocardia brasiliensis]|uniref:MlaD family protein n=1 Tax=Nocardia brasiliensis TaxID=37326 RepID=UPI00366A8248
MHRLFASRGFMSAIAVLFAALASMVGYVVVTDPLAPAQRYCAQLPDAIGLYPGSHVRVRGVVVGTVVSVRPGNATVRVDFEIDAKYPLHGDVSAATVSANLAADRDLAVLPGKSTAARWDPIQCVTRTLTPKSITETLQATNDLARQLSTADDPQLIRRTLAALRTATTGTGRQADQIITKLGSVLRSPDAAVTQVGQLIDALSSLSASISANWAELQHVLTRFPGVFEQINNEIFAHVAELVDSLRMILPMANEITRQYGGAILGGLDAAVPYVRVLAGRAATAQQIIARIPALTDAFVRAAGPDGQPVLTWAPPTITLPQPVTDELCAAMNAIAPGRCAGPDAVSSLNLAQLIATAGAR